MRLMSYRYYWPEVNAVFWTTFLLPVWRIFYIFIIFSLSLVWMRVFVRTELSNKSVSLALPVYQSFYFAMDCHGDLRMYLFYFFASCQSLVMFHHKSVLYVRRSLIYELALSNTYWMKLSIHIEFVCFQCVFLNLLLLICLCSPVKL